MHNSPANCRVPLEQFPGQPTLTFANAAAGKLITRERTTRRVQVCPRSLHRVAWRGEAVAIRFGGRFLVRNQLLRA